METFNWRGAFVVGADRLSDSILKLKLQLFADVVIKMAVGWPLFIGTPERSKQNLSYDISSKNLISKRHSINAADDNARL